MLERRVRCPQCAREIRLSEAELADKRGFCAFCDARFGILADTFIGDGPMRELPVSRVALVAQPPTSARVGLESAAPDAAVRLTPERTWSLVGFTACWCGFLIIWYAGAFSRHDSPLLMKLFPILHVAVGFYLVGKVVWMFVGHERIAIAGGRLEVTRSLGGHVFARQALPLAGVVRLTVRQEEKQHKGTTTITHYVTVASSTEPPVRLGRSIGLDADDAEWLRAALEARLQRARA
jgi:hypothetical protein